MYPISLAGTAGRTWANSARLRCAAQESCAEAQLLSREVEELPLSAETCLLHCPLAAEARSWRCPGGSCGLLLARSSSLRTARTIVDKRMPMENSQEGHECSDPLAFMYFSNWILYFMSCSLNDSKVTEYSIGFEQQGAIRDLGNQEMGMDVDEIRAGQDMEDLPLYGNGKEIQPEGGTMHHKLGNKGNAKECSNYCTISHASKVMLKILQARLQKYVDQELPEVQVGFRRGRGTRDQIANICWIMEKAREFQKNIHFCFIDYAKAFDCVDHNKLNLYAGQEATVRTGHGTTDWFKIEKGVWRGCILSPGLFNLYAEHILRKAGLDESPVGIKIAGRNINNLRYADDTTLMTESELKSLLMRVKEERAKVGLKLNIKKTKIMASNPLTSWQINGEEMEVVTDFIFLGSKITTDGDCSHEIKRCLLLGRKVMANLDSILKSRDITLQTNNIFFKKPPDAKY
ncbi:LINE-1 retrotransposable element ORF2 protein [Varanus komodoensis]|nr:LINE-1 retrotransposable element ORF2 protein [Varanus komodoensis]